MAPMKTSPGEVQLHKPFKIFQAKLEGAKKTNNKKIITYQEVKQAGLQEG